MKLLSVDDLSQYEDADFANLEQAVAKERKRRSKIERSKAKLHQLADTLGYTLEQKDSKSPPPAVPAAAKRSGEGTLGSSTG